MSSGHVKKKTAAAGPKITKIAKKATVAVYARTSSKTNADSDPLLKRCSLFLFSLCATCFQATCNNPFLFHVSENTPHAKDSAPRQWKAARAALVKAGVSCRDLAKVQECVSGAAPLSSRKKLLKLLSSASEVYCESARAIARNLWLSSILFGDGFECFIKTGC